MKKITAIALLLCMLFALAACGQTAPAQTEQPAEETPAAEAPVEETPAEEAPAEETPAEETPAEEAPAAAEYKLGMGVVVSTDSSKTGTAQVDATVAAVVLDAEGKIVACRIDCAQNKMDVTDGAVEMEKEFKSKVELKEDYNMVKFSDATLEWYQQAANFEEYVVGKTADEVAGIETTLNEEGHTVAVDETLYASVSISIADFQAAIAKACADEQGMSFTAEAPFTMGLACISEVDAATKAATAEEDGSVNMYTEFAAVVLDGEGKILADLQDAIQPKIAITAAGEIGETNFKGTKRELKEDYNMVKFSDATLEWYQQAANFEEFAIGQTAADLQGVETTTNEEGHEVFVDETLHASVSISVDGMIAVLLRAMEYAR